MAHSPERGVRPLGDYSDVGLSPYRGSRDDSLDGAFAAADHRHGGGGGGARRHLSKEARGAWRRFEALAAVPLLTAAVRLPLLAASLFSIVPHPGVLGPFAVQGLLVVLASSWAVVGARGAGKVAGFCTVSLVAAAASGGAAYFSVVVASKLLGEPSGGVNTYWAWLWHVVLASAGIAALEAAFQLAAAASLLKLPRREGVLCCPLRCCASRGGGARGGGDPLYSETRGTAFLSVEHGEGSSTGLRRSTGGAQHAHRRSGCGRHLSAGVRRLAWTCSCVAMLAYLAALAAAVVFIVMSFQPESPEVAQAHAVGPDCDSLAPDACLLPFPSDRFMSRAATNTGWQLSIGPNALPTTRWGQMDPTLLNEMDGFSPVTPILFALGETAATINVATVDKIAHSVLGNATTALIDVETGELVPHWVDRDAYDPTFGPPHVPLMVMQPAAALRHNATYVVAVRGLVAESDAGRELEASVAFAGLRDRNASGPAGASRAAAFERVVWPAVARVKWARSSVQLAWYFATGSRGSALGRAAFVRDAVLEAVGEAGPSDYVLDEVVDVDCPTTAAAAVNDTTMGRTIWGHVDLPNFLQRAGPGPLTYFTRGGAAAGEAGNADGIRPMPSQNGVERVNFLVRVPCSLLQPPADAPDARKTADLVLQYGHGLFGSRREAEDAYLNGMANRYGWVIMASDWEGMAQYDVPNALRLFLARASEFPALPERTQQGFAHKAALLRMLRGHLAADSALLSRPASGAGGEQVPLVSSVTPAGYYGNSQGSVVGGGYFASNPDLRRGVLGVPGCPFGLLLSRSKDFSLYYHVMKLQLWSERDVRIAISAFQQPWSAGETGGWLWPLHDAQLPGVPAATRKSVLMQAAMGDAQVTTVSAHFLARSINASTVHAQTRPVFGVREREAPFADANALVEYRYLDVPVAPTTDTPADADTDTHECPRRERRGQDQIRAFLASPLHPEEPLIVQTCKGPRGCESPTCPSGDSNN